MRTSSVVVVPVVVVIGGDQVANAGHAIGCAVHDACDAVEEELGATDDRMRPVLSLVRRIFGRLRQGAA